MNYDRPELQEKLAAEYVLGTLAGPARRRFVKLMQQHREFRTAVAAWEARLSPLADGLKPIEPPAHVWKRIEARIGIRQAKRAVETKSHTSFWESLNFWRPFAVASSALAFGLFVYLAIL